MRTAFRVGAAVICSAALSHAQTPTPVQLGSVALADASVTSPNGAMVPASGGRSALPATSTVTAKDHTAPVTLDRGGRLLICRGTGLHITGATDRALLLGLDRGALEVQSKAEPGDILLTPDMRLTFHAAGDEPATLDLAMRVNQAGDTCIDNRGKHAPLIEISNSFGDESYQLKPGQHVTFERGDLHEVVDKETVPCGCPPDEKPGAPLADALIAGGASTGNTTPQQAAAQHPFPAAVSDGLAPPSPLPPETSGQTHVQVAASLGYDPSAPKQDEHGMTIQTPAAPAPPAPVKKQSGGPFGAIGRFFKKLFVR
jgi:hypothetical protein